MLALLIAAAAQPPTAAPVFLNSTNFGATCEAITGMSGAANEGTSGEGLASLAQNMVAFPPLGAPSARNKLKVSINVGVVRVEQISPADSSWKMRVQTDMYWDKAYCSASESNQAACDAGRFGGANLYFVSVDDLLNPDGATPNAQFKEDALFAAHYENGHCLAADYSDLSLILVKNYVPLWFPYESYLLQFKMTAVFSNETVELLPLDPSPDDTMFRDVMPPGWTSENGVKCVNTTKREYLRARGANSRARSLERSQLVCSIIVSSVDDSWFLTVFIFWMVTLAANLLMGVGTFGGATNARELEDALVARGAFSSSLVLAYVFVVPANPHSLPIGTQGIPTSTQIFVWGLVALTLSAFYSFVLAKCLTIILRERETHGKWYEPFLLPADLISEVTEAISTPSRRLRPQMGIFGRLKPGNGKGTFAMGRGIAMTSSASGREHVAIGVAEGAEPQEAADGTETAAPKGGDAGGPAATAGRGSLTAAQAEKKARVLATRTRVALIDLVIWSSVHLVTMIVAGVLLSDASNQYRDEIEVYKAAALSGADGASANLLPGGSGP